MERQDRPQEKPEFHSRLQEFIAERTSRGHSWQQSHSDHHRHNNEIFYQIADNVRRRLAANIERRLLDTYHTDPESRRLVNDAVRRLVAEEAEHLSRTERADILNELLADLFGYGPIQPLVEDPSVSEIMVNGPSEVWIERKGKLFKTDIKFRDGRDLRRVIERIVQGVGRRIDESNPIEDARLPDGSRVNAVLPPVALDGPYLTIRKFGKIPTTDDLIAWGAITREGMDLLRAFVQASFNIVVSGGTSSGKTTLLNALSSFIPPDNRIITIEDSAELQLQQPHVLRHETRKPNVEGKGEITIQDLVRNALRQRPDRIVVGECRGKEAFDMLQAMNTGHDGSMTTIHANSPHDAMIRLENMVQMAGKDLPSRAIRQMISSAIDVVIQVGRLRDGSRKVLSICQVGPLNENGDVIVEELLRFQLEGERIERVEEDGKQVEKVHIIGKLVPTGAKLFPNLVEKMRMHGIEIPPILR